MNKMPSIIIALLLSSLTLTVSRAVTLPFVTIYLMQHFQLAADQVGLILGISLAIAIFSGVYGGYLIDKFSKSRLISYSIMLFSICFLSLPWLSHSVSFAIALTLIHTAYTIISIAIKACFASWLSITDRIKAFSINYTVVNIGWAVGPVLGLLSAKLHHHAPFVISGGLALLAVLVLSLWFRFHPNYALKLPHAIENPPANFKQTLLVLKADNKLILFTIGSMMGAIVFGQFTGYLSQYLVTIADAAYAYQVISTTMVANAVVVITLQYFLSSKIQPQHLMRWLAVGTLFFIFGLLGFMHAMSIPTWIIAMVVFTIGEIITIPAEYLFVDYIAPSHLKGSYYGAQSLSNLGSAISPVICGAMLTHSAPENMFYLLITASFLGLYFFYRGYTCRPTFAVITRENGDSQYP